MRTVPRAIDRKLFNLYVGNHKYMYNPHACNFTTKGSDGNIYHVFDASRIVLYSTEIGAYDSANHKSVDGEG